MGSTQIIVILFQINAAALVKVAFYQCFVNVTAAFGLLIFLACLQFCPFKA